jgi:uncharacterized membrane protein
VPETPAVRRLEAAGLAGALAAIVAGVLGAPWQLTVLAGWNSAAVVYLVWVWATVARFNPHQTHALSTREDNSWHVTGVVLLTAASSSLVGVVFGLHEANQSNGSDRFWLTAAVLGAVVSSWCVVHTVYTLRYAHLFYNGTPGGVTFCGEDEPDYLDFAYLSFTLGMTFQVSDNNFTTRQFRRAALMHCLLSYVFGTVIIATSINVVAGLV